MASQPNAMGKTHHDIACVFAQLIRLQAVGLGVMLQCIDAHIIFLTLSTHDDDKSI